MLLDVDLPYIAALALSLECILTRSLSVLAPGLTHGGSGLAAGLQEAGLLLCVSLTGGGASQAEPRG